jgi:hypothetical protein
MPHFAAHMRGGNKPLASMLAISAIVIAISIVIGAKKADNKKEAWKVKNNLLER